jgi:hypothetical protein
MHCKGQFVVEPILEEELVSIALDSGVFSELRSSCREIITLRGSHSTTELEDAVAVGVILGESEIEVGELIAGSVSLHEAIEARNGNQLFHGILSSIRNRDRQNIKRDPAEGICANYLDAISEDRADQIVRCIDDLIWDFSTEFDSPHSSQGSPQVFFPPLLGKATCRLKLYGGLKGCDRRTELNSSMRRINLDSFTIFSPELDNN